MQKLTIEWSEEKTSQTSGKVYKKVTAKDEAGATIEASVWSDAPFYAQIAPGATIEAEVKKSPDGKYTNLVGAKIERNNPSTFKTAQIEKAMDKKAGQIAAAQDRSAWMWAKVNASTLIANSDFMKRQNLTIDAITEAVIELATNIYNGEPTKPF